MLRPITARSAVCRGSLARCRDAYTDWPEFGAEVVDGGHLAARAGPIGVDRAARVRVSLIALRDSAIVAIEHD